MRRVRQAEKRTYYLRHRIQQKDDEGNTYDTYSEAIAIKALIRHASGKLAVEQYGERLNYILKMQYDGPRLIVPGDGICVNVDPTAEPDYKVVSSKGVTSRTFNVYDLEAVT